ncbi:MAG: three-Cys-motif partner protein TcmP [Phycisphaerales bacterium]|nr:three-Cys-motif partner protein TcmP [Phycisphaerales bacterium]
MATKRWGRVAWEHACSLVERDDGLDCVETGGMWTAQKLFFLCSYLVQVVRGMHGNSAFPGGITFIDCFAGAGACRTKDADGRVHRLPGSTLIAASIRYETGNPDRPIKHFDRIISVERDPEHLDALKSRMQRVGYSGRWEIVGGDFNICTDKIAALIPARSLNVAFVDPYSLDVHFSALESLARSRSLDLIILFSDRIDLQRNVELYYKSDNPKLDDFLGQRSNWRDAYDKLSNREGQKICELFAKIYQEQFRRIGYLASDHWSLDGRQGPMFRLLFASKSPLGMKFCDIARKEDFGGEVSLWST